MFNQKVKNRPLYETLMTHKVPSKIRGVAILAMLCIID